MTQNRTQSSTWFVKESDQKQLQQLFSQQGFDLWLEGLVNFLNKSDVVHSELEVVFHDWGIEQLQAALDYFSNPKFADLVNAIFFYKIHPDKLFADVIHPEKLISVQMRLGILHYYVELMQKHLNEVALQNGLGPGVDYFLHDHELPQGIMIDVNEDCRPMIQTAVKGLKLNSNSIHKKRVTDCLHDLGRAYKFWFNPNRLIDAVMMLQQNWLSEVLEQERNSITFQEKMVVSFSQLTTTECLDLYGYFANNDTRYLLYTFSTIARGGIFEWLPSLNNEERTAVIEVFNALCSVIEALRIELRTRHLLNEPYMYDLANLNIEIDHRNQEAVFRAITIYKHINVFHSNIIEQLFESIEKTG